MFNKPTVLGNNKTFLIIISLAMVGLGFVFSFSKINVAQADDGVKSPDGKIVYTISFSQDISTTNSICSGTKYYSKSITVPFDAVVSIAGGVDDRIDVNGSEISPGGGNAGCSGAHSVSYTGNFKKGQTINIDIKDNYGVHVGFDGTVTLIPLNPINGQCGKAATNWNVNRTSWPSTEFCKTGTLSSTIGGPSFPAVGKTVTWVCKGDNGGTDATCKAEHTFGSGEGGQPINPKPVCAPFITKGGGGVMCNFNF